MRQETSEGKSPGRKSIMWDAFSDSALAPFSIPILVMQAAHPDVGAAVAKYSVYKNEPWGRLFRTGFSLMRFLYDGKNGQQSQKEAQDLRALHAGIKGVRSDGVRYSALNPSTFRVVPDTFLDGVIRFREAMNQPLSDAEKLQLFNEYRNLCLLFGIPSSELEDNLDQFVDYYDKLLMETMTYNETVKFLLEDMMRFGPKIKYLPMPVSWWQAIYQRTLFPLIRIFTIGFLDPRFRDKHNISWSDIDEKKYQRNIKVVRFVRKVIPRWLRYSPLCLYVMAGGHGVKLTTPERLRKIMQDRKSS
ncbi:oxygenase MpaB family protein [Aurantivibrio infirmus]